MRSLVPDTHKEMGYRKHKTCPNGDPRVQNFAAVELHVEEVPHVRRSRDPMSDSRPGEDVECLRALLHEIIENQREIRTKLLESEVTEALKEEWQLVAKVLDRFFLFASLITIVGATILMLGVIPTGLLWVWYIDLCNRKWGTLMNMLIYFSEVYAFGLRFCLAPCLKDALHFVRGLIKAIRSGGKMHCQMGTLAQICNLAIESYAWVTHKNWTEVAAYEGWTDEHTSHPHYHI